MRAAVRAQGLRELRRDLAELAGSKIARGFTAGLKTAATDVKRDAKTNAASSDRASKGSTRIPRTIRISATARRVAIVAGGTRAPHAGVLEGTAAGAARRHPVFARGDRSGWTWVSQPPKKYLRRAVDVNAAALPDRVGAAVETAVRQAGFHKS